LSQNNLICLSVDGLQAGMLGPYGNAWIRTPAINQLAAQSLTFDQAFAREPSLDAIFTAIWLPGISGNRPASLITDDQQVHDHPSSAIFADKNFYEPVSEFLTAEVVEDTQVGVLLGQAAEWISRAARAVCRRRRSTAA
jgi:hypothetical protein